MNRQTHDVSIAYEADRWTFTVDGVNIANLLAGFSLDYEVPGDTLPVLRLKMAAPRMALHLPDVGVVVDGASAEALERLGWIAPPGQSQQS